VDEFREACREVVYHPSPARPASRSEAGENPVVFKPQGSSLKVWKNTE